MAPPAISSLYTLSFFLALFVTVFIAASLRLLAILPLSRSKSALQKRPIATRVLVVLGSGGHTHEMLHLLQNLDPRKYTHRTYVVSSGDAFSAERAATFEKELEAKEKERKYHQAESQDSTAEKQANKTRDENRPACVGPDHYNIAIVPRARKIHQSLLTTPFSSLYCLYACFAPVLTSPPLLPGQAPQDELERTARDLPGLIVTNGPATAVIVILASLILRFFNIKGANSRGTCKTMYVESFARVKTLSLSGKLLLHIVDRFLVQWEELEGKGGRAEFWGILV